MPTPSPVSKVNNTPTNIRTQRHVGKTNMQSPNEITAKKAVKRAKLQLRNKTRKASNNAFIVADTSHLDHSGDFQDPKIHYKRQQVKINTKTKLTNQQQLLNVANSLEVTDSLLYTATVEKDTGIIKTSDRKNDDDILNNGDVVGETNADDHAAAEDSVVEKKLCPVCQDSIKLDSFTEHISVCLEKKFTKQDSQSNEDPVQTLTTCMEADVQVTVYFCQFCQKDISKMNSTRKSQHINRCMDKESEKNNAHNQYEKALNKAKTSVLDCPICGKHLKTQQSRKMHLKKCANQFGLSTETLMSVINKQKVECEKLLNVGIIPSAAGSALKVIKPIEEKRTRTRTKKTEPKSQFEEDVHVALALSESIIKEFTVDDTPAMTGTESKMVGRLPLVPCTNEVLGKGKRKTGKGKKKKTEDVPALLTTTEKERQENMANKLSRVVVSENLSILDKTQQIWESKVSEKYAENKSTREDLLAQFNQEANYWKLGSIGTKYSGKNVFYVETLVPPLCIATCVSPNERSLEISDKKDVNKHVTQTDAVVDNGNLEYSGFCSISESETILPPHINSLLCGLSSMVNNEEFSDLTIQTTDGVLHAHMFVLAARSKRILKLCTKRDQINSFSLDLSEFSYEAIKYLLRYLYVGSLEVKDEIFEDVLKLAQRFNLPHLKQYCSMRRRHIELCPPEDDVVNLTKLEVLKDIWSDNEDVASEFDEKADNVIDDDDIKEVYEFMLTQQNTGQKCKEKDIPVTIATEDLNISQNAAADEFSDNSNDKPHTIDANHSNSDNDGDIPGDINDCDMYFGEENLQQSLHSPKHIPINLESIGGEENEENVVSDHATPKHIDDLPVGDDDDIQLITTIHVKKDKTPLKKRQFTFKKLKINEDTSEGLCNIERNQESDFQESKIMIKTTPSNGEIPDRSHSSSPDLFDDDPIPSHTSSTPFIGSVVGNMSPQASPVFSARGNDVSKHKLDFSPGTLNASPTFNSKPLHDSIDITKQELLAQKLTAESSVDNISSGGSKKRRQTTLCHVFDEDVSSKKCKKPKEEQDIHVCDLTQDDGGDVLVVLHNEDDSLDNRKDQKPLVGNMTDESGATVEECDIEEGMIDLTQEDIENVPGSPEYHHHDSCNEGLWFGQDDNEMIPTQSVFSSQDEEELTAERLKEILDESNFVWDGHNENNIPNLSYNEDNLPNMSDNEDEDDTDENTSKGKHLANNTYSNKQAINPCLVTPRIRQLRKKHQTIPSPFTPMPNYNAMITPHLKKTLKSYGVRPLPKKKMILLLKEIYSQTHQYETDSECEVSIIDVNLPSHSKASDKALDHNNDEPIHMDTLDSDESGSDAESLLEETIFVEAAEDGILSSPDLDQKLIAFFKSREDLNIKLLYYEPLEFEEIHQQIKDSGIKCSVNKLMDFFDEKGITFTMRKSRKQPKKRQMKKSSKETIKSKQGKKNVKGIT